MPENYDSLIMEMERPESEAGETPQNKGQLSKDEFAAKMKAERDSLSELANTIEMEIAGDGGKFQEYLNTLARFERYSPQNTLLAISTTGKMPEHR